MHHSEEEQVNFQMSRLMSEIREFHHTTQCETPHQT